MGIGVLKGDYHIHGCDESETGSEDSDDALGRLRVFGLFHERRVHEHVLRVCCVLPVTGLAAVERAASLLEHARYNELVRFIQRGQLGHHLFTNLVDVMRHLRLVPALVF